MLLFTTQDMSSYIRSDRMEGKYFGYQSTRIIFQVKKWLNKGLFKISKIKTPTVYGRRFVHYIGRGK